MFIKKKKLIDVLHGLADEMECILEQPDSDEDYNQGMLDAYLNVLGWVEDKEFKNQLEQILKDERRLR